MPNIYVRSTDGSDADNGSTWALAKATLSGAAAIDAAGDTIYVSDNHAEATGASQTLSFASTTGSTVNVICGDDSAEPPTAVSTSGLVSTSGGNYSITINSANIYGLTFRSGVSATGGANVILSGGNAGIYSKNCSFELASTGTTSRISHSGHVNLVDCSFKFAASAQGIALGSGILNITGGSVLSGGTSPSALFTAPISVAAGFCIVDSLDLSNCASTLNLVTNSGNLPARMVFKNCKLPASWTGSLVSTASISRSHVVELYNCDSSDTNYKVWIDKYEGVIRDDTGVYNDAGATDGTTRISYKLTSNANAQPAFPLRSQEFVIWNDTVGASKTVTIEIVHNSQGSGTNGVFTDNEIWAEVVYLGTSGYPLGSKTTDQKADYLATAAAQSTSSASWTGDAAGWDTQKLEVTFTPQEKGYISVVVCLGKASSTVYVDPLITVS